MTSQIADYLFAKLEPKGVAVVARAEHMCMTIRGVQAPGAFTTTSVMRGVFADHDRTAKAEFMAIVNSNGHK
jgi:GTP cyclohydrolase I